MKETKRPYTGVIKVRARNGTVAALRSYISGVPDGDFMNGTKMETYKSKQQYKNGVKHGYFFVWTSNNVIYSRRYYQDGMEDFSRFEDEGVAQTGASLASVGQEWEGTGPAFYKNLLEIPNETG